VALRTQWWKRQTRFSTVDRVVAVGASAIWIGASVAAILLGLRRGHWNALIIGTLGLWYGILWLRAARKGRRLQWREAIWPWRSR
jgi:hypothetical protein